MEVLHSSGPQVGATIKLAPVELLALFNILGDVASGAIAEKPERDMAARLRAQLDSALGESPNSWGS